MIGSRHVFCLAALVSLVGACKKDPPQAVLGTVGDFAFTDHRDRSFTPKTLRGHVTVANFIFTRCPTVCPVETLKMKRFSNETRSALPDLKLVSISVDPTHDSPAVLAAFAEKFGVSDPRWHFVTGDATAVRATVEGALKIALDRRGTLSNGVPDIVHGTHFVLLDKDLRIRGYYDSSEPARLDALRRDAAALIEAE